MALGHTARWRLLAGLALVAVLASLCTGCLSQQVDGTPQPTGDLDAGTVAGLPVTQGPSGLRPGVGNVRLRVQGGTTGPMDTLAEDALADIDTYWRQRLPSDFGRKFSPVKKLVSFDSTRPGVPLCGGQDSHGVENAFYCPLDDSVAWDRGVLLPTLDQMFGPMAVVTVFAHEMGHAVQYELGTVNATTPTIVKEQQADCYAGAFIRWVAQNDAPHFQISTGDGLNQVLATMMFIRDQVGTTSVDSQAHGSAFDRVTAFQYGFESGPKRCNAINYQEVQQRITELGLNGTDVDNNVPIDPQTLQLLQQSLDAAFAQNTHPPTIVVGTGRCPVAAPSAEPSASAGPATGPPSSTPASPDEPSTPPASYCPDSNTIDIDEEALNQLAQLPPNDQLGVSGTAMGDFAAFAEIASRFALSVQQALGIPVDDAAAGLRTACLTGSWAGVTRHRFADGPQQQLLLAPDDLDEAVAELLSPHSVIATDLDGRAVPSGFARVQAFRIGFLEGSRACTTQFS